MTAGRWVNLLRYHRTSQFARRALSVAQRKTPQILSRRGGQLRGSVPTIRTRTNFGAILERKIALRDIGSALQNANALLEGRFSFLNHECSFPDPIDWRGEGARCEVRGAREVDNSTLGLSPSIENQKSTTANQFWRFQLHYHEYLLDLIAAGVASEKEKGPFCRKTAPSASHNRVSPPFSDRAWDIVDQWIVGNTLGDPQLLADAWHPYCISRRLPVWILLWTTAPRSDTAAERTLSSAYQQASFLERHLERDLGGNHLLENLKALLMAGAFFKGVEAERWLRKAGRLMTREVRQQILPSGEHFERSPMYHCHVLGLLMDVGNAIQEELPELAATCHDATGRMLEFLERIVHPDGEIPLLGDSCFGETALASKLLYHARRHRVSREVAAVGLFSKGVMDGFGDRSCGNDNLPRENVPLSKRNLQENTARRIGDYWTFRDDEDFLLFDAGLVAADHLPAHAHADLLGIEASIGGRRLFVDSGVFNYEGDEMRQYCRSTAAHNVVQIDGLDQCDMWSRFRMGYRGHPSRLKSGRQGNFDCASASHNAYRRCKVSRVSRWIACRCGGPWIFVDSAHGRGRHRLDNRLHLHPHAQAKLADRDTVEISIGEHVVHATFLSPGRLTIDRGWYCPQFGRRERSQVIRWSIQCETPAMCAWYLTWGEGNSAVRLEQAGERYFVAASDSRGEVRLGIDL